MILKTFRSLLLVLGSTAIGLPQAHTGKGKEIVDRAVTALGGERFLHMQNRIATGRVYSFFHDELSGLDVAKIITEYLPEKPANGLAVRERELLGKKQDYSFLFLENQGWDVTFRGARPISDETWDRYVRTTQNDILYILKVRHDEPGLQYDYVGSDVLFSTHVEIVDITDAHDQTIRVYFDHNTMLPARETYTWLDPETKYRNDEITQFDKYRDIGGGIMWPYSIERERNGYKSYQLFASSVEANQPVPPKTFELPPGAKVLKKVQ
jgi:hypothetical protein